LVLAALATVAVPGLDAIDVRRSSHPGPGVDAAVVVDEQGRRWVVRAPQDAAAGAALEAEVALLEGLAAAADAGTLPFAVPRPAGYVGLDEGGRAVVHPQLPGRPLRLETLGPGPGLAAALGRLIATIHELPTEVVEHAGLPVYDAEAYRARRLSEVDEAAGTGLVPTSLLRRWERALEDVALWRFVPTVVHGDLSAEHVLCDGDEPTGVLGWAEAKVADPADDLAWLLVAAPQEAVDPIIEAYHLRRTELRDPNLASRAPLAGGGAGGRWLLHGVRTQDQAVVEDARGMLLELEEHLALEEAELRAEQESRAGAAAPGAGEPDDDLPWDDEPGEPWEDAAEPEKGDEADDEVRQLAAEDEPTEADEPEDEPAETDSEDDEDPRPVA
jgi:aminoglycoside phosphotransferase (APT) family kinase protein